VAADARQQRQREHHETPRHTRRGCTARDVDAAIEGILATRPDVVLLGVHLPGGGGRAVLEARRPPRGAVPRHRRLRRRRGRDLGDRAGAGGYVTKSIVPADLVAAIRTVRDGDAGFSPRPAGFVLDASAGGWGRPSTPSSTATGAWSAWSDQAPR
jgi:DNA-binding NarL/FixJ family response regulator